MRLLSWTLCAGALFAAPYSTAAQTAAPARVTAAVSGRVLDAAGSPAADVEVSAEQGNGVATLHANTDASGNFVLSDLQPGSYTLRAVTKALESDRSAVDLAPGSHPQVRLTLHASRTPLPESVSASTPAGNTMEFVDKPSFTVAGVTDWTAVGGHGSDATLRTSEELNRDAAALRAQGATSTETSSSASAGEAGAEEARLRSALALSPQSAEPSRALGLFYLNALRFREAIPLLQTAVRVSGRADDEYHLALALKGAGDAHAAQLHMKGALLHGDAADFHRLAGDLDEQLGDPLNAVQQYQRAAQLEGSEENYFAWGAELLLHRAIWQAADVFAKGAGAYPASLRIRTAWGAALFAGALYEEAADKICKASDLDPSAREPYVFAGEIALASPTAAPCIGSKLERFLALRPNDAEANYLYAMVLLRQGAGQERARELLLRAVTLDPKCSDAYLQLGILSAAHKDYAAAIAAYRKALDADPQKSEAHYRLGVAYDRTGDAAKAKAEYLLHEQIDAANAALVEQQRREVKQFSIVTNTSPAAVTAR